MLDNFMTVTGVGDDLSAEAAGFLVTENSAGFDTSNLGIATTLKEIEAACNECQAFGDGEGFFGSRWHKRIDDLLVPSFRLSSSIGNNHALLAFVLAKSGWKTTKATRSNSPLVCVQITARPHDTHQRKLCSGWAQILHEAHAKNISVEGFAEWVKGREKKSSPVAMADKPEVSSGTADSNPSRLGHKTLELLASVHTEVRDAVEMPGSDIERLQRVIESLQARLDDLKATRDGASASKPSLSEHDASARTTEGVDE